MAPITQMADILENASVLNEQLDCFRNLTAIIDSFRQRERKANQPNIFFQLTPEERRQEEEKKKQASIRKRRESKEALIYIIVVLMFYAFSIVVLMIKYIHRQSRQWEEEKMLKEVLNRARQMTLIENKYLSARHFSRRLQMQLKAPESSEVENADGLDSTRETLV